MATASADVVKVATLPVIVPVPIAVPASKNVTVPVGEPTAGATAETVAVNVTPCPNFDGLTDEANATALVAFMTTWLRTIDVPLAKLPSPP